MAKVGIVMGSDSDMPVMSKAADILEELGISYEMTIISAHREPDVFFESFAAAIFCAYGETACAPPRTNAHVCGVFAVATR